ncbi:hypothetical protein RF11_07571 [Thelohanellus kitauei]|uniref:Uncharacterized protein n=1 Tax=Thelohanellus kitauei TaxID=669202 RepID=A0A0C2M5F2_THEKT|nr:hypothetical protein RF11_07571 [Thelohanellus kitauei]
MAENVDYYHRFVSILVRKEVDLNNRWSDRLGEVYVCLVWENLWKVLDIVKLRFYCFLKINSKITEYLQLRESQWLSDVGFTVYHFEHTKEINTKLQGNDVFAQEMYSTVRETTYKKKLFYRQLSHSFTTHSLKLEIITLQITSIEK